MLVLRRDLSSAPHTYWVDSLETGTVGNRSARAPPTQTKAGVVHRAQMMRETMAEGLLVRKGQGIDPEKPRFQEGGH